MICEMVVMLTMSVDNRARMSARAERVLVCNTQIIKAVKRGRLVVIMGNKVVAK